MADLSANPSLLQYLPEMFILHTGDMIDRLPAPEHQDVYQSQSDHDGRKAHDCLNAHFEFPVWEEDTRK
jgi:hypothetical protein